MPVFNHAKPKPSRINKRLEWHPSFMGLAMFGDTLLGIFARPHLDRSNDRRHVMDSAAFAARSTTDKALVYFNRMHAADAIALGPDHCRPEFMQDLEGGFVAGKPELALELKRGLARGLSCHQIGTPKPS